MKTLEKLWQKGKDFLGCEYPIMGGAMSYVSNSNLVAAISNAGAFGVLAASAMNKQLLEAEIIATKSKTNKSFGVNLILLNPLIADLIDCVIEQKIEYVVLAGGIPTKTQIDTLKNSGCKVIAFAPNLTIAQKMISDYKVDALILEGSEAGGHIGPVSTIVLVQEILPHISEVPVFVAGGIGRGEMMVELLKLGASGIQIGTLLVCTDECDAHPNFKEAFIKAKSRNAETTTQVSSEFKVIPVRAIKNKGSEEFIEHQHNVINDYKNGNITRSEASLKIEHYWAGALRKAVIDGDVEYGSLMAGQSVGLVNSIKPVKLVLEDLINEANMYIKKREESK
ncbi:NAD(P)H-dependent flavin oxidoreductase [Rickettsiales bacterium LUAb2]